MVLYRGVLRVRCTVVKLQLVAKKPFHKDYPTELRTLGDHLRKVRLDRGLSQPQVGKILGAVPDTVTCWELNRNKPTAKFARRILRFIEVVPIEWKDAPMHQRLFFTRMIKGQTQRQVGLQIGLDVTTVFFAEQGIRNASKNTQNKIARYLDEL